MNIHIKFNERSAGHFNGIHVLVFLVLSLSLFSSDLLAQDCSDMPGNLVANCGFDADLSSWSELFGDFEHDPNEGFLKQGSVLVTAGPTGNGFEVILRQCVSPVRSSTPYTLSGAIRGLDPLPDSCEIFIGTRSQANCDGGGTFTRNILVPETETWLPFPEAEFTTSDTTVAVSFQVRCTNATENFSFNFDDAYFGIPPLFLNGFENLPE